MKRTIDDRDGNPVEVEIDDTPPETPLDEIIQAMLLARQIIRGETKPPRVPSAMPGHENKYKRKKQTKGE